MTSRVVHTHTPHHVDAGPGVKQGTTFRDGNDANGAVASLRDERGSIQWIDRHIDGGCVG